MATNLSDTSGDQSGFNQSGTGMTGGAGGAWTALTATLPSGTSAIRPRYQTDGAVAEPGFQIDQIAVSGTLVGTAGSDEGWAFDGFRTRTGSDTQRFFNAYVVENRQYVKHDRLCAPRTTSGSWTRSRTGWSPLLPGRSADQLLGRLVRRQQRRRPPGGGLLLPVDAHPTFHHSYDGHLLRPRILSFDSTFGLEPTDKVTVHKNNQPTTIAFQPAVSVFDDTRTWWFDQDEHASTGGHVGRYQPGWVGVDVPKTGTTIRVSSVSSTGFMQVTVAPK